MYSAITIPNFIKCNNNNNHNENMFYMAKFNKYED